ncbi:MAG TPA: cytochrome c [Gemmatimonadales bacterium]
MRIPVVLGTLCCAGAAWPADAAGQGEQRAARVSEREYEGWRQYSVHCARCHGQDVLGNPVAANLLESSREGGPMAGHGAFATVVKQGRLDRGMPAFEAILTDDQVDAIYAYVKGRAAGTIAAGRPARPSD